MATYNAADGHVPDDDASLSAAHKARIRSAGGAGAAAFLEALPNRWATQLTNEQMVIACKPRLGLPLAPLDLNTCICKQRCCRRPSNATTGNSGPAAAELATAISSYKHRAHVLVSPANFAVEKPSIVIIGLRP
jgi:hypothetical protein